MKKQPKFKVGDILKKNTSKEIVKVVDIEFIKYYPVGDIISLFETKEKLFSVCRYKVEVLVSDPPKLMATWSNDLYLENNFNLVSNPKLIEALYGKSN